MDSAAAELRRAIAVLRQTQEHLLRNISDINHLLGMNTVLWERIHAGGIAASACRCAQDQKTLTSREIQVVLMICEGLQRKEIAARLGISPKTVEFHRQRIAGRLGLKTTASIVRYAIRVGLINP